MQVSRPTAFSYKCGKVGKPLAVCKRLDYSALALRAQGQEPEKFVSDQQLMTPDPATPTASLLPPGPAGAGLGLAPRPPRPLPSEWTHHTAHRVYMGPLDGTAANALGGPDAQDSEPESEFRKAHRQSPLHVLWVLTRTDFRARYRSQALGLLWSLLNPLVMMGILSVIFTRVFRSTQKDFPIFVLIGLLVWQWVTTAVNAATGVFVNNADIIKRTIFLRQLLPMSSVLSYGINFCIESLALLLFIPIFPSSFQLSPALLLVPVLLAVLFLFLTGVGLATSVLNVIYRDVAYLVQTALLIFYWLTPVIYPLDVIPYPFRSLMQGNPVAGVLVALRNAIMLGQVPTLLGWAGMLLPTGLILLLGWRIYRHYEHLVLDYV